MGLFKHKKLETFSSEESESNKCAAETNILVKNIYLVL